MKLWRIIGVATAAEAAAASAAMAVLGLGGAFNGWFDVLNQFAPIWLFVGLLGALGAHALGPSVQIRRWLLALAGAGVAFELALVGPDLFASIGDAFRHEARPPILKLVTINTWSENVDPERTVVAILAAHPDVVAVQEDSGPFGADHAALTKALPYRVSCPGGSDLAIYSATRPSAQGCAGDLDGGQATSGAGPIWMRVQAGNGREVTLVTTHMVWPFPPDVRKAQLLAEAALMRQLDGPTTILVGDFNLAPWSFAMRRQDALLRPLTRRTHAIFTWPARFSRLKVTIPTPILAIDHIYAGSGLRSAHVRRLPLTGSDHYGLVAWFYS